ncbi:MAG: 2-C-methyl-D-erythritol 2,4-cyclodiphosphate synthase [candidate division WS2 bacterium]|uniref:2-C-methyl-D-erythritol 2,4-cyclodiphosphate synthase n=1 Tax=Psychracetigena formicireducens TaxID=2986056 RepID=A0A9E2BG50_PSYF1|nr:2-C-methyl-D-erythritol 2,4-cyclodiphosphate synthase [Candidatus Psychracetigena formicireducens]MBT9144887.1 2-C-methyl-D-erythritol 2,4-cyclodiphosphate synthase [Candidatus Psychracetigena formicireducens]MBT9149869.1 2-C-methyl-D-erythritol 2,4-cyclodiphosphate synthase [Candidatus Psychracetigena formicireducens]
MRVGFGYDIHPLKKGRRLILGGQVINHSKGLKGHSDADVVIHALMDALLGATGKGDIGLFFPTGEKEYLNISSLVLLNRVKEILLECKFIILNIDITIVAESPVLKEFYGVMKNNISQVLEIDGSKINIKATTSEGLGPIGRKKGMEAYAVCMLKEKTDE